MLNRSGLFAIVLSLLIPIIGHAQASASNNPQRLVQETSDQILGRIKSERQQIDTDPDRLFLLIDELLLPHIDFEKMSRWVLGKHWRSANPQQRQQFVQEFRNLVVRTYSTALLEYSDQTIRYLPLRSPPEATEVTVRTEIDNGKGISIPINYDLYLNGKEWLVQDVTIDGVSLVSNYRTNFASQIRRGGVDGLLQELAQHNVERQK